MESQQELHAATPSSPWTVPQVGSSLKFTTTLLGQVLQLGGKSPNHSLKAQHLLSRGIEVLLSIQHYLYSEDEDLLGALKTLDQLKDTETYLTDSIVTHHGDGEEKKPLPCHQAVMSSWHLNRNAFTARLKNQSKPGSPTKDSGRWTAIMKDVVRADDMSFATRLSDDVERNCEDEEAKKAVKSIVASLDNAQTPPDEKTRTDSILGIMCLADEATRTKGTGLDSVVRVVKDMAGDLSQPETGKWKSISDRMHELPVCRKVEKPLLIHKGDYPIPSVIEDAQAEVLSAGASIGGLLFLGISEPTNSVDSECITKARGHVEQIQKAVAEGTRTLKQLSEKASFDKVAGGKNHNQISYSTMHLFGEIAMALTPAVEVPELEEPLKSVTASVSRFINALTAFRNGPGDNWKATLLRSLKNIAMVLNRFGKEDNGKEVDEDGGPGAGQGGGAASPGSDGTHLPSVQGNEALGENKGSASKAGSGAEQSPPAGQPSADSPQLGGGGPAAASNAEKGTANNAENDGKQAGSNLP